VHIVSNSWGFTSYQPYVDPNMEASLQHAASVGTTFYFGSGDNGSNSNVPPYPASSPYVVAVGGTTLTTGANSSYTAESAWGASGGGCSPIIARPSWQAGVGAATCAGRAVPDVAADADFYTGAYVYVNGGPQMGDGTSLATPLWAGMAAAVNRYLGAAGRSLMGFSAPRLYQLATTPTSYSRDFHDVTSGNNGYPAGAGWDEATGWGSVNLANLAADWSGKTTTSVTLAPLALATQGQPATFTAVVAATAPGVGTPAGAVTFKDGATTLGIGQLGVVGGTDQATFSTSSLGVGPHAITASYGGDGNFTPSSSAAATQYVNTNLSGYPNLPSGAYNLSNANLAGGYFINVALSLASLRGALLTNANFSGANLSGADLSNSNPRARLPLSANFTRATLAHANLSNSNFRGATFTGANLSGADLSNSNLLGTTGLQTATLTNVIWSNTLCPDGSNSDQDGGTCVGHV
jgi:subtilase family serine protease